MLRGKVRLTPLGVRKQLLIAESELHRARWVEEVAAFSAGLKSATSRVLSMGSILSSAVVLAASVFALGRTRRTLVVPKPSRLQSILTTVRFFSSLWLAFRSPGRSKVDDVPR